MVASVVKSPTMTRVTVLWGRPRCERALWRSLIDSVFARVWKVSLEDLVFLLAGFSQYPPPFQTFYRRFAWWTFLLNMDIGMLHLLRPDPLMSPYVTIRLAYPLLL